MTIHKIMYTCTFEYNNFIVRIRKYFFQNKFLVHSMSAEVNIYCYTKYSIGCEMPLLISGLQEQPILLIQSKYK